LWQKKINHTPNLQEDPETRHKRWEKDNRKKNRNLYAVSQGVSVQGKQRERAEGSWGTLWEGHKTVRQEKRRKRVKKEHSSPPIQFVEGDQKAEKRGGGDQ